VATRNRRNADDDGVDEPVEDAYDDDADADDLDDADDADDLDLEEDEPAPGRRSRGGTATRARAAGQTRADAAPGILGRLARRFRETVAELQKVIWPTRKELLTYTTVVVVFVAIVMSFVAGLDVAFGRLMVAVFGKGD
jgi:preprotein translocase subunit SecE